jgi:acetolactate decarboxylase
MPGPGGACAAGADETVGPRVSEVEFLGALHVELLRHRELRPGGHSHELFQTSTIEALLAGAFDGDVTLAEVLEHGDHGLGTLDGLDGELIVVDGQAWKARFDCTLERAQPSQPTPYAVVVPFSPGDPIALPGPLPDAELEAHVGHRLKESKGPTAIRIDGHFEHVRVRSVAKQRPPYPPLAAVIADQHVSELFDVSGTMVGFGFPDALDGIEMVGWHLHFATDDRARGGHVLSYTLHEGVARVDDATDLHIELPPAVTVHRGTRLDQEALHHLESDD